MNKKIEICGVGINNVDLGQAVKIAKELVKDGSPKAVFTPNAAIMLRALRDYKFRLILNSAELCIPDGEGVLYAAKKQNKSLSGKVAGVDFAFTLLNELEKSGGSLFIYGGTPLSNKAAIDRIMRDYPHINIGGIDGYNYTEDEAVHEINTYAADIVFVCLGSPKQEYFIADKKDRFTRGLFIGLGGTVDIISGKAKRAPRWIINCRLEWLWRSIIQPKRLLKLKELVEFKIKVRKYLKSERQKL